MTDPDVPFRDREFQAFTDPERDRLRDLLRLEDSVARASGVGPHVAEEAVSDVQSAGQRYWRGRGRLEAAPPPKRPKQIAEALELSAASLGWALRHLEKLQGEEEANFLGFTPDFPRGAIAGLRRRLDGIAEALRADEFGLRLRRDGPVLQLVQDLAVVWRKAKRVEPTHSTRPTMPDEDEDWPGPRPGTRWTSPFDGFVLAAMGIIDPGYPHERALAQAVQDVIGWDRTIEPDDPE